MTDGPMSRYRAMLAEGALTRDPAQALAVEKLQILHQRLHDYRPTPARKASRGWFGLGRKIVEPADVLNGLYIYGDVGRGKSMLMDLFFEGAPIRRKRRVHFHAFMQEVHAGVHAARMSGVEDPIPPVCDEIVEGATLLCFDELQVTDITDAMILGRLFQCMFERGVVVVATSNRPPDDLYKHGLNRQLFLPFIALLKQRLDLHALESPTDHRQGRAAGARRYFSPLGPEATAALDAAWDEMTGGADGAPLELTVHGRKVVLPRFADGVARAGFKDLCGAPLGPGDHLAVARAARTLILDDAPTLSKARYDEAKRFVTLIDALYEAKSRLVMSAAAEPGKLYVEGDGAFEFARTASRLAEMQSQDWPPVSGT
jgi:cell division protein ZapE